MALQILWYRQAAKMCYYFYLDRLFHSFYFIILSFRRKKREKEMSLCVMETGPELRALPLCVKPVECAVRVHDSIRVTLVIWNMLLLPTRWSNSKTSLNNWNCFGGSGAWWQAESKIIPFTVSFAPLFTFGGVEGCVLVAFSGKKKGNRICGWICQECCLIW